MLRRGAGLWGLSPRTVPAAQPALFFVDFVFMRIYNYYERGVFMIKRVSVSMEEEVLDKIDKFASEKGMTRSALFQIASEQYIRAVDLTPSMNKAFALMGTLADMVGDGRIDSDDYHRRLNELEGLQSTLSLPK